MKDEAKFLKALELNVNAKTKKKAGLTYLSWSWAWIEFKKIYPEGIFEVWKDESGKPYIFDENLGYMVFTQVTANGEIHNMQLPVMDGSNKAMKNIPSSYRVKDWNNAGKYIDKPIAAATMFDINTAIMRCLVKNLAMFGIGTYIYSGEDIPEISEETKKEHKKEDKAKKEEEAKNKLAKLEADKLKYDAGLIEAVSEIGKVDTRKEIEAVWKKYKVYQRADAFVKSTILAGERADNKKGDK